MRTPLLLLLFLSACAANDKDPRVDALETRVAALEARKPEPPKPDPRVAELEKQLGELKTLHSQQHAATLARLTALGEAAGGNSGGAQMKVAQLDDWGWHLRKDRKWVTVGDGDLEVELDLEQDSVLLMTTNGHCHCEPSNPREGRFGRDPHHDKWLTLSFFVNSRNVTVLDGFREFHPPQLTWGQIHTHPATSWALLVTTQTVKVKAGKYTISLKAMQNSEKGTWRLHGTGMYVLALPAAK